MLSDEQKLIIKLKYDISESDNFGVFINKILNIPFEVKRNWIWSCIEDYANRVLTYTESEENIKLDINDFNELYNLGKSQMLEWKNIGNRRISRYLQICTSILYSSHHMIITSFGEMFERKSKYTDHLNLIELLKTYIEMLMEELYNFEDHIIEKEICQN